MLAFWSVRARRFLATLRPRRLTMTIRLVSKRTRKQVAWWGLTLPPKAALALKARGYSVTQCTDKWLENTAFLSGLSAVVFAEGDDPQQLARGLGRHGRRILNYDCVLVVLATSKGRPDLIGKINERRLPAAGFDPVDAANLLYQAPSQGVPPRPHVQHFALTKDMSWDAVANFIFEQPPGPAPNLALVPMIERLDGTKDTSTSALSGETKLLLQRAFADCAELHLTKLDDGRSGGIG